MGKVDDAKHTEDEGQADAHERVDAAGQYPRHKELKEGFEH